MAALALSSANGLLLKGGKEASHSNKALMDVVKEALATVGAQDAISLVNYLQFLVSHPRRRGVSPRLNMTNSFPKWTFHGNSIVARCVPVNNNSNNSYII